MFFFLLERRCLEPAKWRGWLDPGHIYSAEAANLLPGTTYFYQVGSPVRGGDGQRLGMRVMNTV
jgi:hypothetical protein